MQQLAIRGTYQEGVIAPENKIMYDEEVEVVLVFPIREDTSLVFENVEDEETRLIFEHPLIVNLSSDENIFFLSYPALDISAYGYDLREATQAFHDIFIATFETIQQCPMSS